MNLHRRNRTWNEKLGGSSGRGDGRDIECLGFDLFRYGSDRLIEFSDDHQVARSAFSEGSYERELGARSFGTDCGLQSSVKGPKKSLSIAEVDACGRRVISRTRLDQLECPGDEEWFLGILFRLVGRMSIIPASLARNHLAITSTLGLVDLFLRMAVT